ncbi:MAG TPA: hypothetical protein VFT64_06800 [Rickettsiales bacterium]|nr:hypothetical protein [Rickettsiales bacterium]
MDEPTELTPLREQIEGFRDAFKTLTNTKQEEESGIHPVIINGQCRGVRLGKYTPCTEDSICLMAGTHHYEIAGWQGIKNVLDAWRAEGPYEGRNPLSARRFMPDAKGDIYLMFGGEEEQMDAYFKRLLDESKPSITPDEAASYRNTIEGVNRNRVPATVKGTLKTRSHEILAHDYKELEREVYSKCKTVIDFHGMSQHSSPVALPYAGKLDESNEAVEAEMKEIGPLLLSMGASTVIPGSHAGDDMRDTRFLVERPTAGDEDKVRMTYECGGPNLDPKVWEHAGKAGLAALEYCLGIPAKGPQSLFFEGNERPVSGMLQVFSDIIHFYTPGSPKAANNPPGYVPENLPPGEWGEKVRLLNGHVMDATTQARVAAKLEEEGGLQLADILPGQLANGAFVRQGTPIAYTEKGGEIVILRAPCDGNTFMAPLDGQYPQNDPTYLLFMTQQQHLVKPVPGRKDEVHVVDPEEKTFIIEPKATTPDLAELAKLTRRAAADQNPYSR